MRAVKTVPIEDLFITSYGNKFDLNKMTLAIGSDPSAVNFVARTAKNLGVSAIVKKIEDEEPYEAGCITVALGGSILSTFVQPEPFYTAQNIMVLIPRQEMTYNEKVFYCICIEKNKFRYNAFGREANRSLKNLHIPASVPKWVNNFPNPEYKDVSNSISSKSMSINTSNWKSFKLSDLFDIERGRGIRLKDSVDKGKIPLVTAIDNNNGWSGFSDIAYHKGNVISVPRNGNGVAEAFYQPKEFSSTEDVHIFNPKFPLNTFIALFLTAIIRKEKYRYSYGRKWGLQRMNDSLIKLPADKKGNPDFKFMESYIKSLPYSASI